MGDWRWASGMGAEPPSGVGASLVDRPSGSSTTEILPVEDELDAASSIGAGAITTPATRAHVATFPTSAKAAAPPVAAVLPPTVATMAAAGGVIVDADAMVVVPAATFDAYPAMPPLPTRTGTRMSARRPGVSRSDSSSTTDVQRSQASRCCSTRARSRRDRVCREWAPSIGVIAPQASSRSGWLLTCCCSQAVLSASRARNASADTALAFMPSRVAVCSRERPSTSVYQSTSCHRVGSERKARAVTDPSNRETVAASAPSSPMTSSMASPAGAVRRARTIDTYVFRTAERT